MSKEYTGAGEQAYKLHKDRRNRNLLALMALAGAGFFGCNGVIALDNFLYNTNWRGSFQLNNNTSFDIDARGVNIAIDTSTSTKQTTELIRIGVNVNKPKNVGVFTRYDEYDNGGLTQEHLPNISWDSDHSITLP